MMASAPLLLLALFWGGSFIAIKLVVDVVPPIFAATARVAFSLAFLSLMLPVAGKSLRIAHEYRLKVWFSGLFLQGFPFIFLFWGEQHVSPGIAGVLNGTVPIWTFLLAFLFLRNDETFSARKIAGIGLGFFGVCLIFAPRVTFANGHDALWGLFALLGMALCYAIGTVMNRRMLMTGEKLNLYGSLYQQHISSVLFLAIVMLASEGMPPLATFFHSWPALGGTLYMGLFSTAIGWILFFRLLKSRGSVRTVAITYLVPVVALLGDYAVFAELPTALEMVGAGLIFAGVILIQRAPIRTLQTELQLA